VTDILVVDNTQAVSVEAKVTEIIAVDTPSVDVVAVAQQGPAGPVGPSGVSGAQFIQLETDIAIGGHRIVKVTPTGCDYADSSDMNHIGRVIGMSLSAYSQGLTADIYTHGDVEEFSWNWNLGPIYLATNGLMTQTPPTTGFVQQVATALSPTKLFIELQLPIEI
jgi:hypothetical protein